MVGRGRQVRAEVRGGEGQGKWGRGHTTRSSRPPTSIDTQNELKADKSMLIALFFILTLQVPARRM